MKAAINKKIEVKGINRYDQKATTLNINVIKCDYQVLSNELKQLCVITLRSKLQTAKLKKHKMNFQSGNGNINSNLPQDRLISWPGSSGAPSFGLLTRLSDRTLDNPRGEDRRGGGWRRVTRSKHVIRV